MLLRVDRGADKKIFDIVVCPAESKEGIGRLQGVIGCLRKLGD